MSEDWREQALLIMGGVYFFFGRQVSSREMGLSLCSWNGSYLWGAIVVVRDGL